MSDETIPVPVGALITIHAMARALARIKPVAQPGHDAIDRITTVLDERHRALTRRPEKKPMPVFRCTRQVSEVTLGFEWHGGEYIEVCRQTDTLMSPPEIQWDRPMEVINVWDHAEGKPRINRTSEAFLAKVDEWIAEYGASNLAHDVIFNWSA